MSEELRECAFCGRTEYVRVEVVDELVETGTEEDPEPSKVPVFAVYCGYCGASGPQELDSDDAAHAWNRRAERTCRAVVSHGSHGPDPRSSGALRTMHHACSACGRPIDSSDAWCRHCGAKVVE